MEDHSSAAASLGKLCFRQEMSTSLSSSARSVSIHDDDGDDDSNKHTGIDDNISLKRVVGFQNMGNTCYMNSALQCLIATDPLTDYFRSGLYLEELNADNPLGSAKGQLAVEYGRLLDEIIRRDCNNNTSIMATPPIVIEPRNFKMTLDQFAPQFRGHRQHDAQEFLSYLLDGIHEDLNRIRNKPYIEDKDCDGTNDEEDAILAWQNYLKRDKSPIVDIFQGQLRSELSCSQCQHRNVRFEPFMYLSLPIPNGCDQSSRTDNNTTITLSECLRAYLEKETLTEDNQWYCKACATHVDATKKTDLWILPPILIIHLKRFKLNAYGRMANKNSTVVQFDEYWNCGTEICGGSTAGMAQYDLYAVSYHHGTTVRGGHYTATVRRNHKDNHDCHDDNKPGHHHHHHQWYHCNDGRIQAMDNNRCSSSRIVQENAYVLFYQRRSNSMGVRRQSESRPDLWPHSNSQRNGRAHLSIIEEL